VARASARDHARGVWPSGCNERRTMTWFDRWLEPLAFVIAAAILLVKTC